jgi:hypothetical protein
MVGYSATKVAYKIGYTVGMSEENTKDDMSVVDRIKANRAAIKAAGGFKKWKKPIKAKAKAESDKDLKKYDAMMKKGYTNTWKKNNDK